MSLKSIVKKVIENATDNKAKTTFSSKNLSKNAASTLPTKSTKSNTSSPSSSKKSSNSNSSTKSSSSTKKSMSNAGSKTLKTVGTSKLDSVNKAISGSTPAATKKRTSKSTSAASTLPTKSTLSKSDLAQKSSKKKSDREWAQKTSTFLKNQSKQTVNRAASNEAWKKVEGTAATGAGKGQRVAQTLLSKDRPYVSNSDRVAVELEKNSNSKVEQFASGLKSGALPFKASVVVGLPETNKSAALKDIQENSTAYKVGETAAELAQYAIPYAGLGGKVGKAVTKVPAVSKLGTVGQNLVKSAAADAVIGLPLNASNTYLKRGLTGDEAKKDLLVQEALDFGLGGLMEITPAIVKAFKGMKIGDKVIESADDISKVTADDVAKMTEEEYAELIKRAKSGNATDEEMLKITDYVNEKRGKNVNTASVIRPDEKMAFQTTDAPALMAPEDERVASMTNEEVAAARNKIFGDVPNAEKSTINATENHTAAQKESIIENKKERAPQVLNMHQSPQPTPEAPVASTLSDLNVSEDSELVNKNSSSTEREIISEESGNVPTPNVPKTESSTPAKDLTEDLAFASLNGTSKMKGAFRRMKTALISGFSEGERFAKIEKLLGKTATANERAQAVRTARGTVEVIFNHKLVGRAGNVINEKSYKDLIGQIPTENLELFNKYAQHLHNIDRWAAGTPVFEQTSAEESKQIVDDILKQHPEFESYLNDITSWWNDFMDEWVVAAGRSTPEAMATLRAKYPHYIPTYRVGQDILSGNSNSIVTKVGKMFKQAQGGTSEVIPLEDSFLAQMESIVKSTRKNELYADIVDSIRQFPEEFKLFGRSADEARVKLDAADLDAFDEIDGENLKQVADGVYKLTAYENGEAVSAYISEDLKEALQLLGDTYSSKYGRMVHDTGNIVGLTNLRKTFITGINPVFTVANMMRDLPTYFIQTEAKGFQALSSLGKAVKELATNGEYAQAYRALGGMQSGYYSQGKGYLSNITNSSSPVQRVLSKITAPIQAVSEAGESLPRLAEFITLVEKYGDNYEGRLAALQGASDVTVNFARSAPVTKAMDGWILYLNAAVQGIDKFARTVADKPLTTLGRSAVLLTMPYAALYVANRDNPHYQDLTDRIKQNYFVIPNMLGEVDEDGNAKTFFKIPLNREYGAIMASSLDMAFSFLDQGMDGLEMAAKEFGETMKTNLLPPLGEGANFAPILDVMNNENYAGSKIVPTALEDASPINQTDVSTSNAANNIAEFMNHFALAPEFTKSPMKVDYLMSQFGYPGQILQSATSQETATPADMLSNTFVEPFKNRFTADPRYSSGVVSKFYNDKDKLTTQVTDEKLAGATGSTLAKTRQSVYNDISAQLSDISKQEKEILASSLTTKEKNDKIKKLREQRNELARSAEGKADEAETAYAKIYDPDTANLDMKWQTEYAEKYKSTGISGKTYARAYEAAKAETNDTLKSLAAINATGEGKMAAAFGVSEKSAAKALVLYDAGLSADDFKKAKLGGDSDGNGGVEKATLQAYLDRNYSDSYQKYALFNALSSAKNPY